MTRIFYREYYGRDYITVEGHSGFAAKGYDIICAAVSTLVCTLLNCLRDEEAADRVKLLKDIVRDGYVCIEVEHLDFAKERTKGIVDACLTGLYMLEETYPNYIVIE